MKDRIIIGSTAINHHWPQFPRKPKDIDYAVPEKTPGSTRETEYLENPILFKYFADEEYLPKDALYTLKLSHIFWDINWSKHMFDIQWMQDMGCHVIEDLFYELYEFWQDYHSKNTRSDLKMTSKEFFDNAVDTGFEHDWLHTLISDPPTYTKVLKDGKEVEVSEEKFNKLTHREKLDLVFEEVYIMAWERMYKWHYRKAYSTMLKKFIISHAPMWEALFILENYAYLYKPEFDYFKVIEDGIREKSVFKKVPNKN